MSFDPRTEAEERENLRDVTWEELEEHSSEANAWLAVYGRVYDVSKFMDDHPGGADPLWQMAGQDATSEWDAVGHKEGAARLMEKMIVGKLVGKRPQRRTATKPTSQPTPVVPMEQGQSFPLTMAVVVMFSLFLAYYLFF
eukprot:TRINITY_DN9023_c0_g1_i1.p2 TRINITY_DN9023_c0_g1~~TRINITY_DN9023_c0_g1_i1.p2  ORF type:complete len:140 (+),score=30.76 TRINITY_DN9023_c0_g1_i1:68-487(+)